LAGRVLVEQRVEERQAGLRDTGRLVDERELAEPCRTFVDRHLLADDVGAAVGAHLHDHAVAEAHLEALDDDAVQRQRLRRAHDPLRAGPVGCHEDLLRGHVRDERPLGDVVPAAPPERLRQQPDGQVGAAAVQAHGVETQVVERVGPCLELLDVRQPGGGRVLLVQANRRRDRLPEALDVRRAQGALRPALGRIAGNRPADTLAERDANPLGREVFGARDRDAARIQLVEQTRGRIAAERDERCAPLLDGRGPVDETTLTRRSA
jgi:hypothetical protein